VPNLPRATLGVLWIVALIASTLWILQPFLGAIIWASTIVIATWPMVRRLQTWLWGSRRLAVAAMLSAWLLVLVLPLSLATVTVVSNAEEIVAWAAQARSFTMPPAPARIQAIPIVGPSVVEMWEAIANGAVGDLAALVAPYAVTAVGWIADSLRSLVWLLIQLLLTLAIAAVMYAKGEAAAEGWQRFGRQLASQHGERAIRLAAQAIRGVALGVVGTAAVQSVLAGVGLGVAGVPFAALLAVVTFILCIAQLGPALVLAPGVGWLYLQGSTGAATALLIWMVVVVTLDNVLRPFLMTKGANLPMLLMFAGVLGGLLAFGLIGIFVGPVVLAVSYTLLIAWMGEHPEAVSAGDVTN
jgi:predicted PurR-regulated permease PerM